MVHTPVVTWLAFVYPSSVRATGSGFRATPIGEVSMVLGAVYSMELAKAVLAAVGSLVCTANPIPNAGVLLGTPFCSSLLLPSRGRGYPRVGRPGVCKRRRAFGSCCTTVPLSTDQVVMFWSSTQQAGTLVMLAMVALKRSALLLSK